VLVEFHDDEMSHTFHETIIFSLMVTLAKLVIFNAMKHPLRLPKRNVTKLKENICNSPAWNNNRMVDN
jgi:hypothetical protein